MIILIEKKKAVLKTGSSFDFIMENRFFTGADSYTLTISFPLKGCQENIDIFGHLYRKDNDMAHLTMECEIHDGLFHKYGSISVVEISELEVKTQFLEGRSERNFYSDFDECYINEIPLGSTHLMAHYNAADHLRSYDQWRAISTEDGIGEGEGLVCLPWVNNSSGNIQNKLNVGITTGSYYYKDRSQEEDVPIVGMAYLLNIIKRIFKFFGYSYDFSELENTQWRHIIVCNVLPIVWEIENLQAVLPHWTVTEFLEQVELFFNGEFDIDERGKTVAFSLNCNTIADMQTVHIDEVVDEHQVEIADEEKGKEDSYIEQKNLAYAECNHHLWKYYSCDWAIPQLPKYMWENFDRMIQNLQPYMMCPGTYNHHYYTHLHICAAEDSCYVMKCYYTVKYGPIIRHYMRLQQVNMFGKKIVNTEENAQEQQIRIVPACIDHTDRDKGDMVFLECGELGDDTGDAEDKDENQTQAVNTIASGEKDKKEEFFDKLYVGFWDGNLTRTWPLMPLPIIDPYMINQDNELILTPYSMRLTGAKKPETRTENFSIDQSVKFTFKFIVKDGRVPDVRSIFLIHGKKYIAEKITATFNAESGMSQLMKMVCYRIT